MVDVCIKLFLVDGDIRGRRDGEAREWAFGIEESVVRKGLEDFWCSRRGGARLGSGSLQVCRSNNSTRVDLVYQVLECGPGEAGREESNLERSVITAVSEWGASRQTHGNSKSHQGNRINEQRNIARLKEGDWDCAALLFWIRSCECIQPQHCSTAL